MQPLDDMKSRVGFIPRRIRFGEHFLQAPVYAPSSLGIAAERTEDQVFAQDADVGRIYG